MPKPEFIITSVNNDSHGSLIGRGVIDATRGYTQDKLPTPRERLQIAAELPHGFTVVADDGKNRWWVARGNFDTDLATDVVHLITSYVNHLVPSEASIDILLKFRRCARS